MDGTEREMTLEEWVGKLPECHLARKQYEQHKKMIFHIAQKLNVVVGLNEQEQKWLESLGARFEEEEQG